MGDQAFPLGHHFLEATRVESPGLGVRDLLVGRVLIARAFRVEEAY